MSRCQKCGKPVYFAERKCSLGKEWHRGCLRCEECGKVLNPGQHAQRKGIPYCHVPCYSALFGPTMFGHGSAVEAHNNFGKQAVENIRNSPVRKPDLIAKIRGYNDFYDGKNLQIKTREVNGRLVMEGPLRVHWGVTNPIQLKQKDDTVLPKEWRRSYCLAMANGLDEDFLQMQKKELIEKLKDDQTLDNGGEGLKDRRSSLEDLLNQMELASGKTDKGGSGKYNTVAARGEGSRRRKNREKRLSIINGHLYNVETSVFTPAHGTVTNVTITSLDPAPEVIKALLEKFKVENNPDDFCLCTIKNSGDSVKCQIISSLKEMTTFLESDYPLLERVLLGPLEDEAKIYILEKDRVQDVSKEVAQYINLPEPMLKGFLDKYRKEEDIELMKIKEKFKIHKALMEEKLSNESNQVTKL